MTDEERNAAIERIKQETIARILGEEAANNDVDVPDVEYRTIDKNWNSQKSWMSQLRITDPMNNDMEGVGYYNQLLHDTDGIIRTVMHDKPGFAADPIK